MSVLDVLKVRGTQSAIEKVERLIASLESRLARAREDLAAAQDAVSSAGLPDREDDQAIAAAAKRMRATLDSRQADVVDTETMLVAARQRLAAERRKAEQSAIEDRWSKVEAIQERRLAEARKATDAAAALASACTTLLELDLQIVAAAPIDIAAHGLGRHFGASAIGASAACELGRANCPGAPRVLVGAKQPAIVDRVAEGGAAILARRAA